jgi:predicted unusual protein kinase regulating ubiquinone biosynthesis (AarF/ABC1/UbiB family)
MSIYLKDAGGIVEAFNDLGFLRKKADKSALTKNVKVILTGFSEDGFKIEKINNEGFLEELREFLYEQPFQIPSRTTFLGKAIMTVFSICNGLDKDFDIIANTKPYVEDIMSSEAFNPAKETVLDQVKTTFLKVIPTSRKVFNLIDQLESGEMRIHPSKSFEKNIIGQQAFQTRKIVFAIFGTGLVIAGAQLITTNQLTGIVMMCFGGLITLAQAGTGTGTGKKRRRPHPSFRKSKD